MKLAGKHCRCLCTDEFNVYTREAGAGVVSVSIEGPSQAKIEMVDRHCGYVTVAYVVSKAGIENLFIVIDEADKLAAPVWHRLINRTQAQQLESVQKSYP